MKTKIALILGCLVCLTSVNGCAGETEPPIESGSTQTANHQQNLDTSHPAATHAAPATTQPANEQNLDTSKIISNIIAEICQTPQKFVGETVEIVGYFHGWDLLDEAGGSPPVTRSDWVIADDSGAIYVTGNLPQDLDPASLDQIETVIHLTAIVNMNNKEVYLIAQSIEVITR